MSTDSIAVCDLWYFGWVRVQNCHGVLCILCCCLNQPSMLLQGLYFFLREIPQHCFPIGFRIFWFTNLFSFTWQLI